MDAVFKPGELKGYIKPGPSKSHLIRILMCAFLRHGETTILYHGALPEDALATIEAIRAVGPEIAVEQGKIFVNSNCEFNKTATVNLKESGTAYAFFSVLNCFPGWKLDILAEGTLKNRDYSFAKVKFDKKGDIYVDASKSSQAVSGAIIANAFVGNPKSMLILEGEPVSTGYFKMTAEVVKQFKQGGSNLTLKVEPDATLASVFIAANELGSDIKLCDMDGVKLQPDMAIYDMLDKTEIDLKDNPDLIFTVAMLAAGRKGKTVIKNVTRLKNKESDRLTGAINMLNTLGAKAELVDDRIEIESEGTLNGGEIDSNNDHRVVFAGFLAARISNEPIIVKNAEEAVKKSCPDFIKMIQGLKVV